jgi:hypothetical protein
VGIGDVTIVKLFGALLAATLGVVVVPRLATRLFPNASIGFGSVLGLNALLFFYWRDHFGFPLSDFPALLACTLGLLGLLRDRAWGYVVAGVGFGLAANARPAYLPALFLAVAVAGLLPRRPWNLERRGPAAALVVAGAFVVLLPQVLINHRHHGNWSPFVTGGRQIAMLQLSDGMRDQKYETYVGPTSGYPKPQVNYLDPATLRVLDEEHIPPGKVVFGQNQQITGYGQYARIVFHHPADMAGGYMRRIFNGLDVRYPTPYIRDLGNSSIVLSLLQYTLMFFAIAILLLPDSRRALGGIRWAGIVVLLSPCLTAVPGAVEPRFFLPLQLLIYMVVCFAAAARASLFAGGIRRRVSLGAAYVAFVLVCLTLSSETLAQLEYPGPTLGLAPQKPAALLMLGQTDPRAD